MAKQWQNYTVALNTWGPMSGLWAIIILAKTGHMVMLGLNGVENILPPQVRALQSQGKRWVHVGNGCQ